MVKASIIDLSAYLPERVVTNEEIESKVNAGRVWLPNGCLSRLFGIRERRFAAAGEQVSDMATAAAQPIVSRTGTQNIDCLIFAAACSDLIEPATANIVQQKLGLDCPVFDLKNACNSFTTGLHVASGFITSGVYKNVLVVNGEKLSDAIRFDIRSDDQLKRGLPAFSLGDAGAAALVGPAAGDNGICYQKFLSRGGFWRLCVIQGGGSMYPHDPDKYYFEGHTADLREVMTDHASIFFRECLEEADWNVSDIDHLFTHQVSAESTRLISEKSGVPISRVEEVFPCTGNTAAAAIPLAIHRRLSEGRLNPGDRVALLGLAAGVNVSVQLMIW